MQASIAALNLKFVTFYHFLLDKRMVGRRIIKIFKGGGGGGGGEEVVDGVHNSEVCLKWGGEG